MPPANFFIKVKSLASLVCESTISMVIFLPIFLTLSLVGGVMPNFLGRVTTVLVPRVKGVKICSIYTIIYFHIYVSSVNLGQDKLTPRYKLYW